jgi:anti-sigma factor RsiW
MTRPDVCRGHEGVELYFYDELPAAERADAGAHFAICGACRESLADLGAIRAALASRSVEEPQDGWARFAERLDQKLDRSEVRTFGGSGAWFRIAAAVTLVATGLVAGWTLSRVTPVEPDPQVAVAPIRDRAIADAGGKGLARAHVVLAGLAQKEDGATWSLERRMAATLLPELRLVRQAATDGGRGDLADILIDVETLLLQATYAEGDDAETLARLRGMIDRRDLLMRLSVASSAEPARDEPGTGRGL